MSDDRLLVIDDEALITRLVGRIAEGLGFQSVATTDPEVFRRSCAKYDPTVIVLDLQMPKVDGIQLLREIAQAKSAASIILISGFDTRVLDAARRVGLERGLNIVAAVQKPIDVDSFRQVLIDCREVEGDMLAGGLAHAISQRQLFLEYQPKMDGESRRIVGFEALVRWRHPTRGVLLPDSFIPIAEKSDLIHSLTELVAYEAIRQCGRWRQQGLPREIAINASAASLDRIDLPDMLLQFCAEAEVPAESVVVEITETAAMRDPAKTMDVLTRLRLKGFRLSLDDFGTGYSSLVQLQRLPLTELKVDKSFVMAMLSDGNCRVIVEIVLALAHKLGLKSVGEGVESEAILQALVDNGCNLLQGFHIGRPMSAAKAERLMRPEQGPASDSSAP